MKKTFCVFAVAALMIVLVAAISSASCSSCGAPATVTVAPASACTVCGQVVAPVRIAQACPPPPAPVSCAPPAPVCAPPAPACYSCAAPGCGPAPVMRWSAPLTGPTLEVCTDASGTADFQLNKECCAVRYWVNVGNICGVTSVQIRYLTAGGDLTNAPVVATLYTSDGYRRTSNGRLARGNITASDLSGPLQGQSLDALMQAMSNGTAVVTVFTLQHPCGELAGLTAQTAGPAPC